MLLRLTLESSILCIDFNLYVYIYIDVISFVSTATMSLVFEAFNLTATDVYVVV